MVFVALKRLWNRIGLTLLSISGVMLAVGLVVSIPVFSRAVSFVMLEEELRQLGPFSTRVSVQPSPDSPLSLERVRQLEDYIAGTVSSVAELPLVARYRQMETVGLLVRTGETGTGDRPPHEAVFQDTRLTILPGVASRMTIVDGEPMDAGSSAGRELDVWLHYSSAREAGLYPGERYQVYDARTRLSIPIRLAGTWIAANPLDTFWAGDPNRMLQRALLVRERDYIAIVEPVFEQRLRSASWHLVLDDSQLSPENMRAHADGLRAGTRIAVQPLTDPLIQSPLLVALDTAIERESRLNALLFVLSVPIIGFVLYFLGLMSTITIRARQRETAVMVSRGMHRRQLLWVSLIEACAIVGIGLPLGIAAGVQLAQVMGCAQGFLGFARRAPLPVSPWALNFPLLVAVLSASLLVWLRPVLRSMRTSVVVHEQSRSRASQKPFWQRTYLDLLLVIPVVYAYRQLSIRGTLVPEGIAGSALSSQDPLLFLVPALFALTLSLLLVRLFPILMRIGDWLCTLGRAAAIYLALRQLSRQSSQYTSALLLVIACLGLGGFMASMAASLDRWLIDQAYYAVGADVLIRQMYNPAYLAEGRIPSDGAWMLPIESYVDLPGVRGAARVGMYRASVQPTSYQSLQATFIGIDRLDVPGVLFFRPDFADEPFVGLMNRLASRGDAVLLSEYLMEMQNLEVGDVIPIQVVLVDLFGEKVALATRFTIVGTYRYFPTVYEQQDQQTTIIGNLNYLFDQAGGPELHDIWLKIEPGADRDDLMAGVEGLRVYVREWLEAREVIAARLAQPERVGTFGTLSVGFLAAAAFSAIGTLVYSYASLQERLFRFSILRAVGLSLSQVVRQIVAEYAILMVYGIAGGAAIGAWSSRLFIPFFQAADKNVLDPPTLIPIIAWQDIGRISAVFAIVLVGAQVVAIWVALRKGVFKTLRMGDQE